MGRKKSTKNVADDVTVDPTTGEAIAVDTVMDTVERDSEAYMGKKGHLVGHEPLIHVLPVPAISCRIIMQNEGLPLSRCYQLVGPAGSYKSTMAAEWARWHRICGGGGFLKEAETKPTPDLRNSVVNWDVKAIRVADCDTVDEWQLKTMKDTQFLQKRLEQKDMPGRTVPFCMIVDSLTGKPSERTRKKILEDGHASPHFAIEAQMISDWLKTYPGVIRDWPFTFVGVNHLKVHRDALTGEIDYQVPGGQALKFHCAAIIELNRLGKIKEYANYKAATVSMRTIKNSYGTDDARICVRFKTWLQEDAEGVHRLHSRFEWWEASILYLCDGYGISDAKSKPLLPKINEVCDFHSKSGGSVGKLYWSKRLGVTSDDALPPHDLGLELERHPDVLADLYPILGIQRRPFFEPGVCFQGKLEDYAYVTRQAEAAALATERAQQLQSAALAIGVTPATAPT
jgi:RecA/RadA recombinase